MGIFSLSNVKQEKEQPPPSKSENWLVSKMREVLQLSLTKKTLDGSKSLLKTGSASADSETYEVTQKAINAYADKCLAEHRLNVDSIRQLIIWELFSKKQKIALQTQIDIEQRRVCEAIHKERMTKIVVLGELPAEGSEIKKVDPYANMYGSGAILTVGATDPRSLFGSKKLVWTKEHEVACKNNDEILPTDTVI